VAEGGEEGGEGTEADGKDLEWKRTGRCGGLESLHYKLPGLLGTSE